MDRGIAFNGIVLISTAVDIRSIDFLPGDDLPYVLFVPTYAATAWYHGKLDPELQQRSLAELTAEVADWSEDQLAPALLKGDRLGADERQMIAARLARYTGLSLDYVAGTNLRVEIMRFRKELLRAEKRSVGRADSRYKGIEGLAVNERPEFDPPARRSAALHRHLQPLCPLRAGRGDRSDLPGNGRKVYDKWEWKRAAAQHRRRPAAAMAKNPHVKVFVGAGLL